MQIVKTPYTGDHSLPKLVSDYLAGKPDVLSFAQHVPQLDSFSTLISSKQVPYETREVLVDMLRKQYKSCDIAVPNGVDRLLGDNVFTVTTGHQLCIYTGPLYVIYKIASVVSLASQLNSHYPDCKIFPVFWMASEDHDFEEVNHFYTSAGKHVWHRQSGGAVGSMSLSGLSELMHNMNLSDGLKHIFKECYKSGNNLAQATKALIHKLFAGTDLIVVDGNDKTLKQQFISQMKLEVEGEFSRHIETSSNKLKSLSYKPQIKSRDTNLFYLQKDSRLRIERNGQNYELTDGSLSWSKEELLKELEDNPEQFSPNVILRPLYQEKILPNLAYIGGPGEVSYWLQLKSAFKHAEVDYPILLLRDSFILLTNGMRKKLTDLCFLVPDLLLTKDELIRKFITNSSSEFVMKQEELSQISNTIEPEVQEQVKQAKRKKELQKELKKLLRTIKKEKAVQVEAIEQLHQTIYPGGKPQERHFNFLEFENREPNKLIEQIIRHSNPLENMVKVLELD